MRHEMQKIENCWCTALILMAVIQLDNSTESAIAQKKFQEKNECVRYISEPITEKFAILQWST